MIIAIDFDGTCVAHEYPKVGKSIGAENVLRKLVAAGHSLVLNTMRSGLSLHEAILWFAANEIQLSGVQYAPNQTSWTSSNKCYAHLYIDDAALGCPLIHEDQKPYVDWSRVEDLLIEMKYL